MTILQSPLLPNLLYLSLVAGLWLSALALISPGTGVYELLALGALVLAGLGTMFIPFNAWALIPLGLGIAFYFVSLSRRREAFWLALAALSLSAGSIFIFEREGGGPAVNPLLASVTTLMTLGYFWLVVRQTIAAQTAEPSIDLSKVLGQVGEVRTEIAPMGSAYIGGELWTVRAAEPIPVGSNVRVVDRDGLILIVEPEGEAVVEDQPGGDEHG